MVRDGAVGTNLLEDVHVLELRNPAKRFRRKHLHVAQENMRVVKSY